MHRILIILVTIDILYNCDGESVGRRGNVTCRYRRRRRDGPKRGMRERDRDEESVVARTGFIVGPGWVGNIRHNGYKERHRVKGRSWITYLATSQHLVLRRTPHDTRHERRGIEGEREEEWQNAKSGLEVGHQRCGGGGGWGCYLKDN